MAISRRTFEHQGDLRALGIREVMTPGGRVIAPDSLAVNAVTLMQQHRITQLPVIADMHRVIGVVTMHALLGAGVA